MRKLTLSCCIVWIALLFCTNLSANNELNHLSLNTINDHQARLVLKFAKTVTTAPSAFTMSKPERLIIDVPHSGSLLNNPQTTYNSNIVSKIQAITTHNKLRIILHLRKSVNYVLKHEKGQVSLALRINNPSSIATPTVLNKIEFRNGQEGNSGKIILHLSRSGAVGNLRNHGDKFTLSLPNTKLAKNLAHKYDVRDFKTPAQSISVYQKGKQVELIAKTNSAFELAAYQINKQYVIDIIPNGQTTQHNKDKAKGKRISLNFQNIPVRQVLQVIAEFTDANMIINDSVGGNISLRLDNIPWDQALKIVLQTQGLVDRKVGNVMMIAPAGELAEHDKKQMVAREELNNLGPLKAETFHFKYGKATNYYATLKDPDNTLLSSRGSIILNKRTNMLFVRDTAAKLQGIKDYIDQTDIAVKQVEIEARIVTVNSSFERQIGIKWNVQGSGTANPGGGDAGENKFNLDLGAAPIGGSNPASIALSTLSNDVLIGMELSALEAEGNGEILSSPRLLTADQQEALIEQGTEIPYLESTSSGAASIAFKKAVLKLKVTPQITPDNKVLLKLEVNQDAKGSDTAAGDIPIIDTRHILTNVLVNNGETVVLGGIYERNKSNIVTRVPFLSDIPLLGELFKHRSVKDERKELLIFVTPRIVHTDLLNQ